MHTFGHHVWRLLYGFITEARRPMIRYFVWISSKNYHRVCFYNFYTGIGTTYVGFFLKFSIALTQVLNNFLFFIFIKFSFIENKDLKIISCLRNTNLNILWKFKSNYPRWLLVFEIQQKQKSFEEERYYKSYYTGDYRMS